MANIGKKKRKGDKNVKIMRTGGGGEGTIMGEGKTSSKKMCMKGGKKVPCPTKGRQSTTY